MKYFIIALIVIFGAAAYLLSYIPRDISVEIPDQITIVRKKDQVPVASTSIEHNDVIRVFEPLTDAVLSSEFVVRGQARGVWFFEGNFGVEVYDASGNQLLKTYVESEGEWMTEDYVPFVRRLTLTSVPVTETGTVVFRKANPSDRRDLDDALTIQVRFE